MPRQMADITMSCSSSRIGGISQVVDFILKIVDLFLKLIGLLHQERVALAALAERDMPARPGRRLAAGKVQGRDDKVRVLLCEARCDAIVRRIADAIVNPGLGDRVHDRLVAVWSLEDCHIMQRCENQKQSNDNDLT